MNCLNCGNNYEGTYCPHCGQSAKTKRLHLIEMMKDFINSFIGGDNRFLRTCCDLFVRPGKMVGNYLLGRRIRYYNPLQMFIYTLTAYAFISYILGVSSSIFDSVSDFDLDPNDNIGKTTLTAFLLNCMHKLYESKLYGTLFMALFAVPVYRQFFRKCKMLRPDGQNSPLNFTEHFCVQIYHSCFSMLTSIILLPLCLIKGSDMVVSVIYHTLTGVYMVAIYKQMLGIGWLKSALLNIVSAFLALICVIVFVLLIGIFIGIMDALLG